MFWNTLIWNKNKQLIFFQKKKMCTMKIFYTQKTISKSDKEEILLRSSGVCFSITAISSCY